MLLVHAAGDVARVSLPIGIASASNFWPNAALSVYCGARNFQILSWVTVPRPNCSEAEQQRNI